MQNFKTALFAGVALLATGMISTPAFAHVCDDPRANVQQMINSAFNGKIAELQATYDQVAAMPPGDIRDALLATLRNAIQTVAAQRDQEARAADAKVVAQCEAELEDYQRLMDEIVTVATFGVSEILPERVFHVDMGEVLDGNILGGDNSVFRKHLGIKW